MNFITAFKNDTANNYCPCPLNTPTNLFDGIFGDSNLTNTNCIVPLDSNSYPCHRGPYQCSSSSCDLNFVKG